MLLPARPHGGGAATAVAGGAVPASQSGLGPAACRSWLRRRPGVGQARRLFRAGGRTLFCALLAASCGAILWWEHGHGETRALHLLSGRIACSTARRCAFWLGIAPAWLRLPLAVRAAALLGAAGWIVLMPFWHALASPAAYTSAACWWRMGVVWVADTAAYFVGRRVRASQARAGDQSGQDLGRGMGRSRCRGDLLGCASRAASGRTATHLVVRAGIGCCG